MTRRAVAMLLALALVGAVTGCDTTTTAPQPEVVVEAYLEAGAPLGDVVLTRSVPVTATVPSRPAVEDATVRVERLATDGTVAATVSYDPVGGGRYRAAAAQPTVPGARYRLRVARPGGAPITATTTVPGPIELVATQNERAVYQGPVQPSFTVAPTPVPGRQNVFMFTTTSRLNFDRLSTEQLAAELTPFYRDVFDAADDEDIRDLRVTSSPLLNAANYRANDDGTLTIDLPWIAVAFYGPNTAAVSVLDDNLFDLIRTQQAQQGGLAPGEIPNILDRVDGGTGIFGSFARAGADVSIERPAGAPSSLRSGGG
jgi:hypothetical protein